MKIVVNKEYGGFEVPEELISITKSRWNCDRNMPELVNWVKDHESTTALEVVIVPDNATDYEILDYDGMETVVYVVDGKLYHV